MNRKSHKRNSLSFSMLIQSITVVYSTIILCILYGRCLLCQATEAKTESKSSYIHENPHSTEEMNTISTSTLDRKKLEELKKKYKAYQEDVERPPFTYQQIIIQAILNAPENKATVHSIYKFALENYAFFRSQIQLSSKSWKNTLRHILCHKAHNVYFDYSKPDPKSIANSNRRGRKCGSWFIKPKFELNSMALKAYSETPTKPAKCITS